MMWYEENRGGEPSRLTTEALWCSIVNDKEIESTFYKAPRPSARVLTLIHAPTPRHYVPLSFVRCQAQSQLSTTASQRDIFDTL